MTRTETTGIQVVGQGIQQEGQMSAERRRLEVKFFVVACINVLMLEVELFCFNVVVRFATEKWGWLVTTVVIWNLTHATNG